MNYTALICLLLLAGLTTFAIVIRVDAHKRGGGRIAQYAPPKGINLLMAGVLSRAEEKAVPAQLVSLAISKNLRFIAPERGGERMRLELLDGPKLDADEYELMRTLFGAEHSSERVRRLARKDFKLRRALRRLLTRITERLQAEGFVGSRRRGLIVSLRWLFAIIAVVYIFAAAGGPNGELWVALIMLVAALLLTFYLVLPGEWR